MIGLKLFAWFRRLDWSVLAERVVLSSVLAIAALISYTHLHEVWTLVRAPWAQVGPLTVDGLFAAAWLRMRRRRRQSSPVGWLAWVGLGGALVATLAGNIAAAFPAWVLEQRDYVAPLVYAWAALAFALVFELVTGHTANRRQPALQPVSNVSTPLGDVGDQPGDAPIDDAEVWKAKRDRLLLEGAGRKVLAAELGISEWEARQLLQARASEREGLA